jgi:hypothetical protein
MSYCRFSDNDIYLYPHVDGYICCCCCHLMPKTQKTVFTKGLEPGDHPLFPEGTEACQECEGEGCDSCCMHPDAKFKNYHDAINHVKEHIAAGHHVNDYVIPRLERDCRKDKWSLRSKRLRHRKTHVLMSLRKSGYVASELTLPKFHMAHSQRYRSGLPWLRSTHYCLYPHPKMISVHFPVRKAKRPLARKIRYLLKKKNFRRK